MSRFQDRKLNHCAICKTQKRLAMTSDINGRLYFLCEGHFALNEILREKLDKLHENIARDVFGKDESNVHQER